MCKQQVTELVASGFLPRLMLCRSKHWMTRACSPPFLLGQSESKVAVYSLAVEDNGSTNIASLRNQPSITYGELNTLSDNVASDIRSLFSSQEGFTRSRHCTPRKSLSLAPRHDVSEWFGWQPRVALLCSNSFSFVSALWAAWKVGAIAVPLCNTHPSEEQLYVLKDSGAKALLSTPDYRDRAELLAERAQVHHCPMSDHLHRTPSSGSSVPSAVSDYVDLAALLLYTSGTTGRPKGVLTTHQNLSAQMSMLLDAWEWTSDDVILHTLPLHHLHGVVNALLCPLAVGATVVMATRFDSNKVWDALVHKDQGHRPPVNIFMGVPTMYAKLADHCQESLTSQERESAKDHLQSRIRLMVSGSAPLPLSLFQKWKAISGHSLLERYGMTEVGMALSNSLHGQRIPGSVGLPLASVDVRIVDFPDAEKGIEGASVDGDTAESDQQGELQIKGPAVFQGYWGRSKETADAFTADGWFKTGDIAVYRSGRYIILGRASADIIKSGGFKLSALEIEQVLLDHPEVKDCAVIGVPDDVYGERVAAIIVPKNTKQIGNLSLSSVKDHCRACLAQYKLPQSVWTIEELPRNTMGKVNKKQLVKQFLEHNQ